MPEDRVEKRSASQELREPQPRLVSSDGREPQQVQRRPYSERRALLTQLLTNHAYCAGTPPNVTARKVGFSEILWYLPPPVGTGRDGPRRTRKPLSVVRRIEGSNPSPSARSGQKRFPRKPFLPGHRLTDSLLATRCGRRARREIGLRGCSPRQRRAPRSPSRHVLTR
jgi:hypothetical protein